MKKIIIKLLILVLIIQISFNLIDMVSKTSKAVNKIYVAEGGTYTFTASSSTYTLGDSSIASVSTGSPYSYTAAVLGTDSNYNGDEVDFEDCLYKFTTYKTYYRIKSGNTYMNPGKSSNSFYANSSGWSNVTVTNSNGNFTFKVSYYLYFNANNYFTASNSSSTFNLYKPIESGETSSTEIPGYIKVTSITAGKEYLVVKQDGNDYYLLYPSTSTSNNYAQTAKVKNVSGVDYTITGNTLGTTTLTIDGEQYEITVYDENTILEPDSNFADKALTIGLGTTYKIATNESGFVWTSNDTSIATVTADGTVTPVSLGETTLFANLNGMKYEFKVRVINGASSGLKVDVLIDTDDETVPYYNPNFGNEFYELIDGERVYGFIGTSTYRAVDFWGAPKNGYALSYLYGNYTAITENTPSEVESGDSTNLLNTQANNLGTQLVSSGITNALSNKIEGVFGYSRNSTSILNVVETFTFRSEKLSAEISQEVYSVNGNTYQSGEQISAGDTVIIKVTVSKTASDENLVVYEGTLTNSLSGAVFIGTSPTGNGNATSQSVTINSKQTTSQDYYIKYIVPNSAPDNISNTVSFAYSTYADQILKTASYKIERPTITDTLRLNSDGASTNSYITLTKEVAGNMRETDKYFKFLVTINGTAGDTYRITGQDSTITYNNNQITTSSTYTVGSTNYVYLKGGQTVIIGLSSDETTSEIPEGTTYSIVEQDAEDYATTISGIQGETKTTGNMTVGEINTIEFLNSKDAAALTGGVFEITNYVIIFVISMTSVYFIIKRAIKKKR